MKIVFISFISSRIKKGEVQRVKNVTLDTSGMGRLEQMKRDSGIKDRDEIGRGIEILIVRFFRQN